MLFQSGAELALFITQIDFQEQQLVGIGMRRAFQHGGHPQVDFGEVVVLDRYVGLFHVPLLL
jgi:hypothetical protein